MGFGKSQTVGHANGGKVASRKSFESRFTKRTGAPGGKPSGGFTANPRKFRG